MTSNVAESVFDGLQPHQAVFGQNRPVRSKIEPDAEPPLCAPYKVFSLLSCHRREVVYVEVALAAKAHPIIAVHESPFCRARGCHLELIKRNPLSTH